MQMQYDYVAIPDSLVPRAAKPTLQHALDTYASETNKVISVWRCFSNNDIRFRPHPRSKDVLDIMKHQLLSERRYFGELMGVPEPSPSEILPEGERPEHYVQRMRELAVPRLSFFAAQEDPWWLEDVQFFDVVRQRTWVFWRRVLTHVTIAPNSRYIFDC